MAKSYLANLQTIVERPEARAIMNVLQDIDLNGCGVATVGDTECTDIKSANGTTFLNVGQIRRFLGYLLAEGYVSREFSSAEHAWFYKLTEDGQGYLLREMGVE